MWWYDSSINNIRSKTSILAVRKPNNPKPRRPWVFRLDESSLSFAGFYGFKTVEIEVFDLILLIDESYHLIVQVFLWKKPWFCRFSLLYVTDASYSLTQQPRRWFRCRYAVIFDNHWCASRLNDTDNVAVFLVQGPGSYFLLFCCFEILMNSILLQVYSTFASGLQGAR